MSSKWRIYCRDPSDEGFHTVWTDVEPTTCPNNPAHEVNPNSASIIAREVISQTLTPPYPKYSSLYYARVATLFLDSQDPPIRRITAFANVDTGADSYSLELYDRTTHTSLGEVTFTNTSLEEVVLPAITLNPGINKIDVNVKYQKTALLGRKYNVYLDKICVYAEQ